ncbi:hypothetical protein B0T17DRAFT_502293 [Bombardia bombarda]|uniref:Uncharacterized protein n=1 Tax=Bombardia bombarda TaxID=252184 RepID=A0AA39XIJ3_9PEZI|nr:hypothetical protein B0T17DRAFT_502293 [Bombardia bombarda]
MSNHASHASHGISNIVATNAASQAVSNHRAEQNMNKKGRQNAMALVGGGGGRSRQKKKKKRSPIAGTPKNLGGNDKVRTSTKGRCRVGLRRAPASKTSNQYLGFGRSDTACLDISAMTKEGASHGTTVHRHPATNAQWTKKVAVRTLGMSDSHIISMVVGSKCVRLRWSPAAPRQPG